MNTTCGIGLRTIDSVEGQRFNCLSRRGSLVSEPLFVIDPYCDERAGKRYGHRNAKFGAPDLDDAVHRAFEVPLKDMDKFHQEHHAFVIIHAFHQKKLSGRYLAYKVGGDWRLIKIAGAAD